jgi:hypothetical protein
MKTIVVRLVEIENKPSALVDAVRDSSDSCRFSVNPLGFADVPRSPFAYWARDSLRSAFRSFAAIETEDRHAAAGAATRDNFRFIRCWWERVDPRPVTGADLADREWVPLAKGGSHARFYSQVHLSVRWASDGAELKAAAGAWRESKGWGNHWKAELHNSEFYGRPGITWSRRSQRGISLRALPKGCIFGEKGPTIFVSTDEADELCSLLAIVNSECWRQLVGMQMAFGSFEVGVVQRTPVAPAIGDDQTLLAAAARRAWFLRHSLDTCVESSRAFVLPALLQVEGRSLAERADGWARRVQAVEVELEEIQAEIDERCFDLYGIDEEDRRAISEGLAGAADGVEADEAGGEVDETDDELEVEAGVDAADLAAQLVSWAVGVAFGRFDVRLATGQRRLPDEPGPFDPLPACSPGMLVGGDGLPLASRPPDYPIDFPESGVLVDDPGDPRDLTAAVRAVFDAMFGGDADARSEETGAALDPRGHDLRAWLRSSFFERHLRLHSKSRRKAPILWQLGTPSGRYSIWLYAHRLTDDTLFRVQSDLLAPKLVYEERQLANLVQDTGGSPSARERREIEAKEAFVEELRLLLEEVRRVAPLWKPTLDDGIVLVMAPLWRLVPHKPWQRELKKKWGELTAGEYDWAQLAMHLWPERVIPKCAQDRSLAIAHGLEDVFWFEDGDGKWQRREEPTAAASELIRERTSIAVKDALGATT